MGTGVGEAMLISAVTGAGTSAVMGGDPVKGALLGAATGGLGAGVAGAGTGAATNVGANVGAQTAVDTAANLGAQTAVDTGANLAAQGLTNTQQALLDYGMDPAQVMANTKGSTLAPQVVQQGITQAPSTFGNVFYDDLSNVAVESGGFNPAQVGQTAGSPMFPRIAEMAKSDYFYPGLGVAASFIGDRPRSNIPGADDYSGPLSRFSYDPDRYRPFRAASGGLMDTMPAKRMAAGGDLGSYSDGGQLLKGPGDGMSDDIPASIEGSQPALLADGEFVIPADVVSGIGNGSTDAGARELYAMMERVRKARTGTDKQAPEIDSDKMMSA